jgi:hypothetical protein
MLLGPVYTYKIEKKYIKWDIYGLNIEDCWQCSKVYPAHLENIDHTKSNKWLKNWEQYSKIGRFSNEARRHRIPKGKWIDKMQQITHKNKNIPLFSYFEGEKLSYIQARKKMYMLWYEQLCKKQNTFLDLYHRHLNGENFILFDYDGLQHDKYNFDINKELLIKLIDNNNIPFGHGLVLACCLLDFPLWRMDKSYNKIIKPYIELPNNLIYNNKTL